MDKECFIGAFEEWYEMYKDVVNERVQDKRIKRQTPPYMRPRLRSAYLSVKRNMPLLWTFYDHPETGLPNTNNALEGLFSDLKSKVRVHCGKGTLDRLLIVRYACFVPVIRKTQNNRDFPLSPNDQAGI